MKTNIFYRQLYRSVKTVCTNGLILLVVTAFFVMSLNLYAGSVYNLKSAEDTYRTVAVMELYGDVNRRGELTPPGGEGYLGYRAVAVDGYDLEPILRGSSVLRYDLRARYAAYIPGQASRNLHGKNTAGTETLMESEDIIRFKLEGSSPLTLPLNWDPEYENFFDGSKGRKNASFTILDNAADCFWYDETGTRMALDGFFGSGFGEDHEYRDYYAEDIRQLNRSEDIDHVTLYPGVEYIACNSLLLNFNVKDASNGLLESASPRFFPTFADYFSQDYYVNYRGYQGQESVGRGRYGTEADAPFPLARWEDVQNDPRLKARWEGVWEAVNYNLCAYNICLTDDITGVPVFHLGGAYLSDGRMITREEYGAGAKVCMVSRKKAQVQGWKVGDKLEMNFYRFEAIPNNLDTGPNRNPEYHQNTEGFFDSGEYEIVGLFDQRPVIGDSAVSQSAMAMPWDLIYLPHKAVENTTPKEELPVHGALFTVWLENGSITDFQADMEALGLTKPKEGQYTPSFTYYDQGYSVIQPSLQHMYGTARLLLILSALLLVITCVLQAWFFAQHHRHTVGIYRMLGGKKGRAAAALLACALAVTLLGLLPGALLGHSLAERVGQTILAGDLLQSEKYASLRAFVLADAAREAVSVRADAALSALAACGALLFPLLFLVFLACYMGKEPRELMPKSRE